MQGQHYLRVYLDDAQDGAGQMGRIQAQGEGRAHRDGRDSHRRRGQGWGKR